MFGAVLGHLDPAVTVEHPEEEDIFADPVEEYGIFHVATPACVRVPLPCISQVTTLSLLCWYFLVVLVFMGSERKAPPMSPIQ